MNKTETDAQKDEVRVRMREKRHAVTHDERKAAGKDIFRNLLGDEIQLLLHAWRVCLYLSTKNEIPTRYIARELWGAGREICLPAWSRSDEVYKLYAFDPQMRLITGHHGIREPAIRIPVLPWDVDAFILPGLAFDEQGGRLGYGAGHYDAILAKANKTAPKIALCYDWQVVEQPLPQDAHDMRMDWIVTDKRVINCVENRRAQVPDSTSTANHPETAQT